MADEEEVGMGRRARRTKGADGRGRCSWGRACKLVVGKAMAQAVDEDSSYIR